MTHLRPFTAAAVRGGQLMVGYHLQPSAEGEEPRASEPPERLVDTFAALADAPVEDIATFAERHGPLGLCQHGVPAGHNAPAAGMEPPPSWACTARLEVGDRVGGAEGTAWLREPLTAWRDLARSARRLLAEVAALQRRQPLSDEERRALVVARATRPGEETGTPEEPASWGYVTRMATWWLTLGGLRLTVVPGKDDATPWLEVPTSTVATVHLRPSPMALSVVTPTGAIAHRLARRVLGADRRGPLAVCAACARAYVAPRAPTEGRRTFCDQCRERGVPLLWAQRDRRQRQTTRRAATRTTIAGEPT